MAGKRDQPCRPAQLVVSCYQVELTGSLERVAASFEDLADAAERGYPPGGCRPVPPFGPGDDVAGVGVGGVPAVVAVPSDVVGVQVGEHHTAEVVGSDADRCEAGERRVCWEGEAGIR